MSNKQAIMDLKGILHTTSAMSVDVPEEDICDFNEGSPSLIDKCSAKAAKGSKFCETHKEYIDKGMDLDTNLCAGCKKECPQGGNLDGKWYCIICLPKEAQELAQRSKICKDCKKSVVSGGSEREGEWQCSECHEEKVAEKWAAGSRQRQEAIDLWECKAGGTTMRTGHVWVGSKLAQDCKCQRCGVEHPGKKHPNCAFCKGLIADHGKAEWKGAEAYCSRECRKGQTLCCDQCLVMFEPGTPGSCKENRKHLCSAECRKEYLDTHISPKKRSPPPADSEERKAKKPKPLREYRAKVLKDRCEISLLSSEPEDFKASIPNLEWQGGWPEQMPASFYAKCSLEHAPDVLQALQKMGYTSALIEKSHKEETLPPFDIRDLPPCQTHDHAYTPSSNCKFCTNITDHSGCTTADDRRCRSMHCPHCGSTIGGGWGGCDCQSQVCDHCGDKFTTKPWNSDKDSYKKYCSEICYKMGEAVEEKKKKMRPCDTCGKPTEAIAATEAGGYFCDMDCYSKCDGTTEQMECSHCDKFQVIAKGIRINGNEFYCDKKCQSAARAKKHTKPCEGCGKELPSDHPVTHLGNLYCSTECWSKKQTQRCELCLETYTPENKELHRKTYSVKVEKDFWTITVESCTEDNFGTIPHNHWTRKWEETMPAQSYLKPPKEHGLSVLSHLELLGYKGTRPLPTEEKKEKKKKPNQCSHCLVWSTEKGITGSGLFFCDKVCQSAAQAVAKKARVKVTSVACDNCGDTIKRKPYKDPQCPGEYFCDEDCADHRVHEKRKQSKKRSGGKA